MALKRRESGKDLEEDAVFHYGHVLPATSEERLAAPVAHYENTFQLEPNVVIKRRQMIALISDVLESALTDKTYEAANMKKAAMEISARIRKEMKKLHFDRYKFVCQVTIGQKCEQDVTMACRYLWSPEFDHFAYANFENTSLFASAIAFALYKQ